MFKRSSFIVLLMIFTLAMVLSMSAIGISAQDAPTPTPIVAEVGTGDIHIAFWNGLTGSDGVTLIDMLAEFAAENPQYSVTTEMIPWATLYAKLQAAFVAGDPPDVFLLHATEVPQFASFGLLKDLSSMYASGGGWLPEDDLSSATYEGMIWEGVPVAVPLDNHGRGLWINVDMFEAAGLDPDPSTAPTTYEGWVELFQKLTLDANGNNAASPDFDPENVVQWGYTVGEAPVLNFAAALAQQGGSMVSEDGTTVTVNSPEGILALQQAVDLVYKYHVSPPAAGFDTWQGYASGTVAVLPTGSWFRNFAEDQTDINGRAWPQVQFGPQKATWFGTHAFMIPIGLEGEKLEAVEALIRFVSEHQVDWAASGQPPARLSAQEALDAENYPSNILLGQTFTEYGMQFPKTAAWGEMEAALDPELSAALNNLKPVEQALNDAAERMQQALNRAG